MRILITGHTGKLGRAWTRLLSSRPQVEIQNAPPRAEADLAEPQGQKRVAGMIQDLRPALVVHCAAATDVDACERDPEFAMRVNTAAAAAVAEACRRAGAGLLFYSTDYIFDGTGPRGEEAPPAPINVYGRSKAAAEQVIAGTLRDALFVRINVPLAPPADGKSFYSFLLEGFLAGRPLKVVTDQWNNPLDTDRIARWSYEAWARGTRGILHLGGGTYATRFDIARMVARRLQADSSLIAPVSTPELRQIASRPLRGGLLISKQAALFGTAPDLPTILESLPLILS